ncbi:triose-phosphate isomerase [Gemmata sp. G18]|uniref:Triosephosphate isomerase n=1 Tax=Gemmata palustris TaxID=2822762 RepID=A0ABS5BUY7_9BACT|nr:triose-phosphate isomerase [Gemmata palustris]MBP3957547.1 triose-phosphate isomerase [Gemmata palustris]
MRKKFVAGNWKMNTTLAEAKALGAAVAKGVGTDTSVTVAVCPPFPWLLPVGEAIKGSSVALGAQDVHSEKKGAFTGEVSPAMLIETGCKYVIVGHSERRHILGESETLINHKVHTALEEGLSVILCMGETLAERDRNLQERVFQRQVYAACAGLTNEQFQRLVIAYEPVWAIGTGKVATPEQAQEAHAFVRTKLRQLYGDKIADTTPILYGGSVTPETTAGLMSQPDVDGALVGGASLKSDSFVAIVKAAGG